MVAADASLLGVVEAFEVGRQGAVQLVDDTAQEWREGQRRDAMVIADKSGEAGDRRFVEIDQDEGRRGRGDLTPDLVAYTSLDERDAQHQRQTKTERKNDGGGWGATPMDVPQCHAGGQCGRRRQ